MQEDKVLKWLLDIQMAIKEIETFVPKRAKTHRYIQNKTVLRRAIERNIEIIGEAVNRILHIEPNIDIQSARRIVDTRNFIIHQYERVSSPILWEIVSVYIPILKKDVHLLIQNRENQM